MITGQPVAVAILSDELFTLYRQIIQRETGIFMRDSKKLLVSNRVRKRMRQIGVESFGVYLELLRQDRGEERTRFIDAVTTNETYFYRGESHFVALRETILPELLARKDRVRMWSVGCSTGEEPYTMAMVALETTPRAERCVEILATDISTSVVRQAAEGVYDSRALRCLPVPYRSAYFDTTANGGLRVSDRVRQLVRFSVHNALREEPPAAAVDVIFCRNLMIYFDGATQKRLVDERFARALDPDGYLLIGHSESLIGKSRAFTFERLDRAHVYRRTGRRGAE